ncbi:MAG TPA: Gldg family protein [Spirochaetota bacterium]|nr:Gldg family protein [Spirochaetota bacterium]
MKEKITRLKLYLMRAMNMENRNFQLLLNVVLIIVINLAAAAFSMRVDLTSKDTYSLSGRSRETVSSLNEKLKIKVFFSKDLPPEHAAVFRYLKDILEEYSFYGNGNFSYEIIDEDKLEAQAKDYGINPVQSREFANDQVRLRSVYMGVVIQHADLIEKIESLTSAAGLEYEITSRIEKMTGKIDRLLKLEKPVMVTLYLDERVKDLPIDGIGKLEDVLKNAVAKSNLTNYDKIQFQVIDPSKNGGKGLDALYGISKLKWGTMKSRSGKIVPAGEGFFGLVMEAGGRFSRIDLDVAPTIMGTNVITGLQNLDDTINNGVGDLISSSPKIGYVRGHGIPDIADKKTPEGAGLFAEILSDMYQLVGIDLKSEAIPDDINVLVINGPVNLFTEAEKYKIDQFLMKGKSVLLFVNSFMEMNTDDQSAFMGNQPLILPVSSGLEEMAAHYGIKINKNVVLDKNCAKVNMGQMLSDYPLIPLIEKNGLNRESVITKYINSALFVKASSLEIDEKLKEKGVTASVLVSTSPQSWLMEGQMNFNPFFMAPPAGVEMKSYPVAAVASGKFESFFKGRDIPAEILAADKKNLLSTIHKLDSTISSGKSELIVVGTSELNSSGFLNSARRILSGGNVTGVYSNDIRLHAMVDYLAGNSYVPEMKSKSLDFNPLVKTGDRTRFLLKIINMGLVPVFVILTGLIVWRRRIARKRLIELQFSGGKAK